MTSEWAKEYMHTQLEKCNTLIKKLSKAYDQQSGLSVHDKLWYISSSEKRPIREDM